MKGEGKEEIGIFSFEAKEERVEGKIKEERA